MIITKSHVINFERSDLIPKIHICCICVQSSASKVSISAIEFANLAFSTLL